MTLTGDTFYYSLITVTVLCVLSTIVFWGHVLGHPLIRLLQRVLLLALCQLTAVAVAGVWVNNHYGLYASWSDLLGTSNGGHLTMSGPPPKTAKFTNDTGGTVSTFFRGPESRLAGQVYVWKPPQYDEPAYKRARFPVIELLHGIPGEPQNWMARGAVLNLFESLIASHRVRPALIVMPEIAPGGADTDCSDTPRARGATWLAQDVTKMIKHRFRTLTSSQGWALGGLSTGGFCAIKLSMQFPKIFGAGAGMSSDPFAGDPTVIKDVPLRIANSPLTLAKSRPPVHLWAGTSTQDSWSPPANITALGAVVLPPTMLAPPYILTDGGHNWHTWQLLERPMFIWMNSVLASPASSTVKKKPSPGEVSAHAGR